MDIIDIILARKMATGAAAPLITEAKQAINDANAAIDTVTNILEEADAANEAAQAANEAAETASTKAQAAANTYDNLLAVVDQSMLADFETVIDQEVEQYIDNLTDSISTNTESISSLNQTVSTLNSDFNDLANTVVTDVITDNENTTNVKIKKVKVRKKALETALELVKNYTTTGQNEDGSMTQKAISDKFTELSEQIANIPSGGGDGSSTNLGAQYAGHMVIVGDDGYIVPSNVTEEEVINALVQSESYTAIDAVGLTIDYENRTFERTQEAIQYTPGADFEKYPMYGGRKRCNVNLNGKILAWYGEPTYKDDGSNGDVMVYQPKFYYQRRPIKTEDTQVGKVIRKEALIISATKQAGFKVHPAFVDATGHEVEYILLPAYESCLFHTQTRRLITDDSDTIDIVNDRLHSYGGVKPISGLDKDLTIENAETLARNRGDGWHILNMAALSVTQMLAMIEFGTMNGQTALEAGITELTDVTSANCASQTGSTAYLGSTTGAATSTLNIINGNEVNYSLAGQRAITYRGVENPWGNIWQFIGGINIYGNGSMRGGVPYICKNFNYAPSEITKDYESVGFSLPSTYGWISAMAYGSDKYDWIFMPAEAANGNSSVPVGDNLWTQANLNGTHIVLFGGPHSHGERNGFFYYACDKDYTEKGRNISARIIHLPTFNTTIHTDNYIAWKQLMGG